MSQVMGLFPIISMSWSISHLLIQEPCLLRGHRAGLLHILLPSPATFSHLSAFISSTGYLLWAIPAPSYYASPPILASLSQPACYPRRLSPLAFVGVESPRLPFPSTMWTFIPPLLMISAHVFLVEVLFGHGWWEFFPRPPFFVIGVLSYISFTHFLSASTLFFFLCIVFPSAVFYPSISTGAVMGVSGRGMF
jgi:hypothetical protein